MWTINYKTDARLCLYFLSSLYTSEYKFFIQNKYGKFAITVLSLLSPFFIKYSACSITVSNTTCYCNPTFLLLVFIYICSLKPFILSRAIEFRYLMNFFRFPLVSSILLTGHLPTLSTLIFRISLSFINLWHSNIKRSTVCMSWLYWHSGLPIIFNRCK